MKKKTRSLYLRAFYLRGLVLCLLSSSTIGVAQEAERGRPRQRDRGTGAAPAATPAPGTQSPAPQEGAEGAASVEDTQEINVRNAEISALIRIFSRRLKRNFLLDDRVKGKVTMYLPGKLSPEESLKVLESILALKGFTTVPVSDNLWKVIPSKEARQSTIPTKDAGEASVNSASVVTKVMPLKYVGAQEVEPLIKDLISPDGLIQSYPGTNALILIDYEDNINRLVSLIDSLDVPFSNRDMTIIPIKYAEAKDLVEKLKELLGIGGDGGKKGDAEGSDLLRARLRGDTTQGGQLQGGQPANISLQGRPQNSPPPTGGAISPVSLGTGAGGVAAQRSYEPKLIADERTNSIIIVADDDTTTRIRALLSELDSKVDLSGNHFYVYRCQHANAEELANTLSGLAGGGGGTSRSSTSSGGGRNGSTGFGDDDGTGTGSTGMGGLRGSRGSRSQSRLQGTQRTPGQPRDTSGQGGPSSFQLGENISITADPATNSLVINASKGDYEKLKELIDQLDIKRRQVLVEAMLLEVSVQDSQTLGMDFITSTGGKDGAVMAMNNLGGAQGIQGLLSSPQNLADFSIAAASAGTIRLPNDIVIPSQAVLLSAAKTNSNVNVLSAPTLLATDNEQAEIVVGQNVPFIASTSTNQANLNNTFNQIDRQDVGITLRITPQISSNDFVHLRIFTDVSDVVSTDPALGPTTTVRSSETTVITKDKQMIVIGGLMSDQNNESSKGMPFLKDVPILGAAFKRNTDSHRRTNLLTFITPHVVKDQYDAREFTKEHSGEMGKVIRKEQIQPPREEVLKNRKIDNVAESGVYAGEGPGTLLPPPGYGEKKASLSPSGVGTTPLTSAPIDPTPLSFTVDTLPPTGAIARSPERTTTEGAIGVSEVPKFLAKLTNVKGLPGKLPFSFTKNGDLLIVLPPEVDPSLVGKIRPGVQYQYEVEGKKVPLTIVKRLPPGEKTGSLPAYRLTSFELLHFGEGPWY